MIRISEFKDIDDISRLYVIVCYHSILDIFSTYVINN